MTFRSAARARAPDSDPGGPPQRARRSRAAGTRRHLLRVTSALDRLHLGRDRADQARWRDRL